MESIQLVMDLACDAMVVVDREGPIIGCNRRATRLFGYSSIAERCLARLHEVGVKLHVDDFGTGYSSLLYLRRFPIDTLKLDRSFVNGVETNPEDRTIVSAVIDLAHGLDMKAVAEGVETANQAEVLRALRCDMGQGHRWAPPMPALEVARRFDLGPEGWAW